MFIEESPTSQVRILRLVYGEHNNSVLYRLRKEWKLRFMLGPTLVSRAVDVFSNCPQENGPFDRLKYSKVEWHHSKDGDQFDSYAEVVLNCAGPFQYYFTCEGKKCGSGYFMVDPILRIGADQRILPLDAVCMQTVLTKLLGKFSGWKDRLMVAKESGYNVLHFTPLQLLGCSNSSYSIADQLQLDTSYSDLQNSVTFDDVKVLVDSICQDWSMLSVTDLVWNHTATNSPWLEQYPESGYNLVNSPYLKPAYLIDRALFHLSLDIEKGEFDESFPDRKISCENAVEKLKNILKEKVVPCLKIWEFFQVDIKKELARFASAISKGSATSLVFDNERKIEIVQDMYFKRFGSSIDLETALVQFYLGSKYDADKAMTSYQNTLKWLNDSKKLEIQSDLDTAINNVISTVVYERLAENGPKTVDINKNNPIVTQYFSHPFPDTAVSEEEKDIVNNPDNGKMIMAHNGWVMGTDVLKNFAEYPTKVYLRRELICWGDSVKLRYGASPEDCPPLWERMRKYTEMMAGIFHGIRIDNCHNTPIHVAEYMLDAARRVRPDLYVFAELFTGSENVDNTFVNRLGITSLIREALAAWDSHELGRLVYLYGGEPIASFTQPGTQVLEPSRAHALFYDVTHDNESMIEKHSINDVLPSSGLVCMASCAIGSNRGHDELVPHHIHVVKEKRLYKKYQAGKTSTDSVQRNTGVLFEKHMLNTLHQTMALNGFSQVFVDQRSPDVVAVTRHNPQTHYSYVMISYTSFPSVKVQPLSALNIEGVIMGIAMEASPKTTNVPSSSYVQNYAKDSEFINGITNYSYSFQTDIPLEMSSCCEIVQASDGKSFTVNFPNFNPGSLVVLRVKMSEKADQAVAQVRKIIANLQNEKTEFDKIISQFDFLALQRVLYRCDEEEKSDGLGISAYGIPGWETLHYCGIAGLALPLQKIRSTNDLGHPICQNLRDGNWLMDYTSSRLCKHENTQQLGNWYAKCFEALGQIPRYLVPKYFQSVVDLTYKKLLKACWNKMCPFVKDGSSFVKLLSLGSLAMCAYVKGATIPDVDVELSGLVVESDKQILTSMAAGLPHFSSGVMRCWGRDTFIALPGLLLVTGRQLEARNLILAFAGCLRHGLIPNLLGEGKICRYNCRDAVWFWLQCIQEYCEMYSYNLLKEPVKRIFPTDDSEPILNNSKSQPLYDVMQEALQRHVDGISFRERGAGPGIDQDMSDKGFDVVAGIDLETGFVYGGSEFNCGTWCDKMGSSIKAKNKGIPSTPRDGSAVELVGLCKSAVQWLHKASNSRKYPYDCVFVKRSTADISKLTWSEWNEKISENFEKHFFVGDDDNSHLVHKRHIYKDTVGATHPWCDYQLRPNFPLAMVFAPEMFVPAHAWQALEIAQDKLLGPLGIKTLDPDDMQYRGDYDNSNDSDDRSVAKGFNYHQGPEWLWPVGFLLRAKLYFAKKLGQDKLETTVSFIHRYLVTHHLHLERSDWGGLPELTNSNGSFCYDSCPIQAWSHATLLDLIYNMNKM